jgi:hypothetical protein
LQAQLKTTQTTTRPKFLIELAKPTQRKIAFKKFPTLQKNKIANTKATQKSSQQRTETDGIKMVVTHDRQERQLITFNST